MSTEVNTETPASQRPRKPRSTFTLWLILAVCLAPIIGSTALYYLAPPKSRMNYGELISPGVLPDITLAGLDGKPVALGSLRGKWTMVHVDEAGCATDCRDKLYKMRQVRLTQGKNMDRVQRLWVVSDDAAVDPGLLGEYAGTIIVRADPGNTKLLASLPPSSPETLRGHIWLVDPLGNVMLRFPPAADPSRMKTDLTRVLRVSRVE
jgi:hypothetical protein